MADSQQVRLPDGFQVRKLTAVEEYHAAEELQCAAWGIIDRVDVTPTHVLITAQKNGGLVLGAFAPDGSLAGWLFGFLGTTAEGELKHVSHQMGVDPAHRGLNLGYLLKRAQRGEVRRQGLSLVTWTFDPLETVNANLNLTRLGAVCSTYLRNVYGEIRDSLNRGLPSDRFQVDWWIRSEWVHERLSLAHRTTLAEALSELPVINRAGRRGEGLVTPGELDTTMPEDRVLLQVPYSFQAVKGRDLELGRAWRMHTREAFEHYFGAGYSAIDLLRGETAEGLAAYYVLYRPQGEQAPWYVREHTPEVEVPPIATALVEYARLFNAGQFWKAHEALEATWSETEGPDKTFLQGLIRAAAAFHKLTAHHSPTGAVRHLTWVIDTLTPFGKAHQGVDLGPFVAGLRMAQEQLQQGGEAFDTARIPRVQFTAGMAGEDANHEN